MTLEKRLVMTSAMPPRLPSSPDAIADHYCSYVAPGMVVCRVALDPAAEYFRRLGTLWFGTGGSVHAGLRFDDPQFSGAAAENLNRHVGPPAATVPEMLGAIKEHLQLTLVDIARALLVQRPTIYAWLDGSQEPRESNVRRLSIVHRVAEAARVARRGRVKSKFDAAERAALLQMIEAGDVDENACREFVHNVVMAAGVKPQSRPRLSTTGTSAKSNAMQDTARQRAVRRFGGRRRG